MTVLHRISQDINLLTSFKIVGIPSCFFFSLRPDSSVCLSSMLQLEAGQFCTFVIHADGSVSACGKGSYSRLGLGDSNNQSQPKKLTFDSCHAIKKLSSSKGSDGHTLAVTVDGQVFRWGDGLYNYLAILYMYAAVILYLI